MNMMQEKNTREYFLFLSGLAGVFVILALVLSWFHGRETQQILFEREQIFVSSLMEQGVSHVSIARRLGVQKRLQREQNCCGRLAIRRLLLSDCFRLLTGLCGCLVRQQPVQWEFWLFFYWA